MSRWDAEKQRQANAGLGLQIETGSFAFSGTSLTVEVPCIMGKSWSFTFSPKTQPSVYERFYSDGIITSQGVTVTRQVIPIKIENGTDGTEYVSTNNWEDFPVGFSPVTGQIKQVRVWNKTKAGGSPVILLGSIKADGTKDVDAFIAAAKTKAMPTSGQHTTLSADADFTSRAITAGDLIIFGTSGGDTTAPAGLLVQVEIEVTPTVDLEMFYTLMGW